MPQDTEKHTQNIVSGGEIRVGIDVGGTFTDVVIADERGDLAIGKALTTPARVFAGMQEAIAAAADERGLGLAEILAATDVVIYGTTRATNAIVERRTAKTALLLTEGFPNILVLREGGKEDGFDFTQDYPDPYIPQHHTFEVPERVDAEGGVVRPIDRDAARAIVERIRARAFEAVAVCLLWSIVNPDHELAIAELLDEIAPGVPYTLSHRLLPVLREYRRASATAIDASLKPLMREHLREMEDDLRAAGYRGEVLVSTAIGGCMAVRELAERPIHSVRSGPSMAPGGRPRLRGGRGDGRRRHRLRHRRDHLRREPGARGRGQAHARDLDRRPLARRHPGHLGGRRAQHRRRRRLDRLDRPGRVASGRAAKRRRRARPGLLRQGRRRADGDRRRRSCWDISIPSTSSADAWRSMSAPRGRRWRGSRSRSPSRSRTRPGRSTISPAS